jgi:hypothetical protein
MSFLGSSRNGGRSDGCCRAYGLFLSIGSSGRRCGSSTSIRSSGLRIVGQGIRGGFSRLIRNSRNIHNAEEEKLTRLRTVAASDSGMNSAFSKITEQRYTVDPIYFFFHRSIIVKIGNKSLATSQRGRDE